MGVTYFKRFKMEIDLGVIPSVPPLPQDYAWQAWDDSLLECHADVTCDCFHDELDATVFPNLGTRHGCHGLMEAIRNRPGFVPEATWLIIGPWNACGAVQGRQERGGWGAIQNLGIREENRGRGLGTALLLKALHGFRRAGLGRAYLEVTAQNDAAIRLYRRLGFRCRKTLYKAVGEIFSLVEA
jgi:GNAT superfamily N-acetyltransferase